MSPLQLGSFIVTGLSVPGGLQVERPQEQGAG